MHPLKLAAALLAASCLVPAFAQAPPAPAGGGRGATEQWYVNKTKGGVYKAPMKPLWKKVDLLAAHRGQNNWSEQIILDPENDVTYNSGAPGSKIETQMHPDTPTLFVVIQGEVNFTVEGQQPVHATRGSLVNIMHTTLYSYEVTGSANALWVEINPTNYKTVYPASGPMPKASADGTIVKVAFGHRPGEYVAPNRLHYNTFTDGIDKCEGGGTHVLDDHIYANPIIGYANAADNKCPAAGGRGGGGGRGRGGAGGPAAPFNPASTFGHMHPGPAEWWVVQAGGISGRFENMGEYHAVEGDVLYAAPMMWHQMGVEGPSGPSIRLALGGYNFINMNNTAGAGGD
jgi:mannose-6-phosphate isomerase-like protein (cupin superfamily)